MFSIKINLEKFIAHSIRTSNSTLVKRIGLSLKRDKALPVPHLIRKGYTFAKSLTLSPFYLRRCDKVGSMARTKSRPYIENLGSIEIGNGVNINSSNVRTDLLTGIDGKIIIGNDVSINFGVSIVAENKVTLGNRIRIGPYTMIIDTDRHIQNDRFKWAKGEPVIIEDDVWLATRVMVLKGSLIGKGSMIASGSVVSGVIPPYVVAGGIPARVLKFLKKPESDATDFEWQETDDTPDYTSDTAYRVKQVFSKVFPEHNQINWKETPATVVGWDSFAHVRLVRGLELEFDIRFARSDWARLSNLKKMCKIIESYQHSLKTQ